MTCAKTVVKVRLACQGGSFFYGENSCQEPQAICPRAPGESYFKCYSICKQPMHAEVAAIKAAIDAKANVHGGYMLIHHKRVCTDCQLVMRSFNITWELAP